MEFTTRNLAGNYERPTRPRLPAIFSAWPRYWSGIESYQKATLLLGVILLATGIFHGGVFLTQGGSLAGPVSWRKPITFGFSFGFNLIAIGWLLSYLPKQKRSYWTLVSILGISELLTVVLVAMQQWRGVPSHFNFGTSTFNAVVAGAIVFFTIPVTVVIVTLTIHTFSKLVASPSLTWAMRLGMVLMVVGLAFGYFAAIYARIQFIYQTGQPQDIFGEAGSTRLPHSLALYAFHLLFIQAWLMQFADWLEEERLQWVGVTALGCIGIIVVSAAQMFRGLAFTDMDLPTSLIIGTSVAAIGSGYLSVIVRFWKTYHHPGQLS